MIVCQVSTWYFFLPVQRSFNFASIGDLISLVLATLAQLLLLWAMYRYADGLRLAAESEAQRAAAEADRVAQLQLALRELDHRTMNNFQLASAVLRSQQTHDSSAEIKSILAAASQKMMVLAAVHRKLTYANGDFGKRPLAPLLEEVLEGLRGHVIDDGIVNSSSLQPVDVSHERALHMALIVNELVTNALKHSFPTGKGCISVDVKASDEWLALIVEDDGAGRVGSPYAGSGSRLIDMLAKSVGGSLSFSEGPGTTATLAVPIEAHHRA